MSVTDSGKNQAKTGNYNPVELEKEVAERWKKEKTFENSIENRRSSKPFTFLEGPPTANGKPGIHHVLSRLFKDMVCSCLLYTSPSPRDGCRSRMPSSA